MRALGVEGGGTSWRARVVELAETRDARGATPSETVVEATFETTTPSETLGEIRAWIEAHASDARAIGVATFGPIALAGDAYGHITTTPKPGWGDADVLGTLFGPRDAEEARAWRGERARARTPSGIPLVFDTDVNAPALLEGYLSGQPTVCYVTVGTGVGVGIVAEGRPVHGVLHPEAGHVHVKMMEGETFAGCCPFHGTCVEGMVGSNALAKRRGVKPADLASLPDDDEIWEYAAHYLAGLCVNLTLILAPHKIVLGGGVMNRECLYQKIRDKTRTLLSGYLSVDTVSDGGIDEYIVKPVHGAEAGIAGAIFLAENALL